MYRSYWQTHYREPIALPELEQDCHADVCVIGLGGTGLSAIYTAQKLGLSVVGIDANNIASGAAGCNGGFLLAGLADFHHTTRQKHGHDLACQWYENTLRTLEWMQKTTPDCIRLNGSLRISTSTNEDHDCEHHYQALQEDGFSCDWYHGPENRNGHKALCIPTDGVFNPFSRCQRMASLSLDAGAKLFINTKALHIEPGQVQTHQGTIYAERILVCVDGKLESLIPELGARIQTWRLQMLATQAVKTLTDKAVYQRYGYDYWQQLPSGEILIGGGRDVDESNEATHCTDATEPVQNYLEKLATEQFGSTIHIQQRWAASVAYTVSGLPIQEKVQPDVWAFGAYNGTGNVIGPLLVRQFFTQQ